MSKSTIQNWNAKSQTGIQNVKAYAVFDSRDPNSQFAMQSRNQRSKQPVCSAESKSSIQTASLQMQDRNQWSKQPVCNAESKSLIQTASLQWRIEISDPTSQFTMQNRNQRSKQPVRNAKSKSEIQTAPKSKSGMVMHCAGRKLGNQANNNQQGCLVLVGSPPDRRRTRVSSLNVAAVRLWEESRGDQTRRWHF